MLVRFTQYYGLDLNMKVNKKQMIIILICSVLVLISGIDIGGLILKSASTKSDIISKYIVSYRGDVKFFSNYGISLGMIYQFFIILIVIITKRNTNIPSDKQRYVNIAINLYLIKFIVSVIFNNIFIIPNRLSIYFDFSYLIVYPYLINIRKSKNWIMISLYIMTIYLVLVFSMFLLQDNGIWIPYKSFIFHKLNI